jgi:hypothetical protein
MYTIKPGFAKQLKPEAIATVYQINDFLYKPLKFTRTSGYSKTELRFSFNNG